MPPHPVVRPVPPQVNTLFCVGFMHVEPGWTFVDAFYHCMMTATTVGFGEIGPETQAGRQGASAGCRRH